MDPIQKSHFMEKAISLSLKSFGKTQPNPLVGAVLVDDSGEIIATGYHKKAGAAHAEVDCLKDCPIAPENSTLFVTLEPCNHTGRTPPCTQLLIDKKISKVIIGTLDPNPLVSGKGVERLKEAGIAVEVGILETECREINQIYNHHITTGLPFITIKAGITLDGRIALASGESKWITNEESREVSHHIRSQRQGILIGKKTLIKDNPQLNVRHGENPTQPVPIVISNQVEVFPKLEFFKDKNRKKFWLAKEAPTSEIIEKLLESSIEVLTPPVGQDFLEWGMKELCKKGIVSILIEGGGVTIAEFVKAKLVNEMLLFMAPKLIGGTEAPSFCGDLSLESLAQTPNFEFVHSEILPAGDLMLILKPKVV
ncbi:MAG: bifunctional diaminohydroxyphosphoribosylaminopyrimidine deaminase/5-amino-6-(5-phosphoribosylamino)uracil reductase RibD [SAR324 cluster bacterium]|nr:bifunctional diaminohydroxyphosphoribosylaminopyrimidine deaminase/5-amino-6-(5-phosphoribosylamino)uracil reductase RibD [SAR324 cluster bacterium]